MRQRDNCMKIKDILDWLDEQGVAYDFIGNSNEKIHGFSSLSNYKLGTLTWIKKEDGYNEVGRPKEIAGAVVQRGVKVDFKNAIMTECSKESFFSILHNFWGISSELGNRGEGTVIVGNTEIDSTVTIGCNCSIVGEIKIAAGTIIENNVVIQGKVIVGKNCIIHSGTVIGCDGYGYYFEEDGTIGKVEHFGGVEIADQVEIGANVCIDRGTIDNTFIGFNSKIDNLVHIAHNAQIGKNVCIVASATICGSARLMDGSYIAPGGIVKNQITIGNNGFVGLGAVATKNVEDEIIVAGVPAKTIRKVKKGDK